MASLLTVGLFGAFVGALTVGVYGVGRYVQHYRRDRYDATATGAVVAVEDPDPALGAGLPDVAYEYAVGEETLQNDRLRATTGPLSTAGFETLVGDLAVGDTVRVHVDSEDPSEAVLIPPESGRGWALLAGTALTVALLALVGVLV